MGLTFSWTLAIPLSLRFGSTDSSMAQIPELNVSYYMVDDSFACSNSGRSTGVLVLSTSRTLGRMLPPLPLPGALPTRVCLLLMQFEPRR